MTSWLVAEVAGIALALELATSVNYLLWIPVTALLVWIVIWRVRFETMERIFGLLGLMLVVFAVAVWKLGPDWGDILSQASNPSVPQGEGHPTYAFLRGRPLRRGHDALRGLLLLLRRGGGPLDEEGPQHQPLQRLHRLPLGRPALAGDHVLQRDHPGTPGHHRRPPVAGGPDARHRAGQAGAGGRAAGVLRGHLRRRARDRAVRRLHGLPALRLAVGEAGASAARPPASTPWCCAPCSSPRPSA